MEAGVDRRRAPGLRYAAGDRASRHDDAIDVLPYLVGEPASWPRRSYRFTDGRWLPRFLPRGDWELDIGGNRIREFDRMCREQQAPRRFPYRLRAWHEGVTDAGTTSVCATSSCSSTARTIPTIRQSDTAERFSFARGAGWYLWKRADGAGSVFNRRGGPAVADPLSVCLWR